LHEHTEDITGNGKGIKNKIKLHIITWIHKWTMLSTKHWLLQYQIFRTIKFTCRSMSQRWNL